MTDEYINYHEFINMNTSSKKFWKKTKKMNGKYVSSPLPFMRTAKGDLAQDPQQTSKIFAESFACVYKTENNATQFQWYKQSCDRIHVNSDTNHFLK